MTGPRACRSRSRPFCCAGWSRVWRLGDRDRNGLYAGLTLPPARPVAVHPYSDSRRRADTTIALRCGRFSARSSRTKRGRAPGLSQLGRHRGRHAAERPDRSRVSVGHGDLLSGFSGQMLQCGPGSGCGSCRASGHAADRCAVAHTRDPAESAVFRFHDAQRIRARIAGSSGSISSTNTCCGF